MSATAAIRFASPDGTMLEGEVATAADPSAAVVLCHPHPQYGGSMRAGLVGDLFRALPAAGLTALRFNFRGVERSEGTWDDGRGEQTDAAAATETLTGLVPVTLPVLLVGWSFGADMALSVRHPRVGAWCAIAPPLHYGSDDGLAALATDPRPTLIVLGERDDVVAADRIATVTATWVATTCTTIAGADHFFTGRSAEVVAAVLAFAARVTGAEPAGA